MINPPLRLLSALQAQFNETPEWVLAVPGRDMWVGAMLSNTHQYAIHVPDLQASTIFDRRSAKLKRTVRSRPLPRWARYLAGAIEPLCERGLSLPGGTILIMGDEPAGPRYEHALGMGFASLWYAYHQREVTVQELLDIVEHVQKHYFDH